MKSILILLFMTFFSLASEAQQKADLVFVFLNKKPEVTNLPLEQSDKLMEGHMANINRLAKEGKLIVAGPFDGGGGIFVLKAKDANEAKGMLANDPAVQAERWNIEYLPVTFRISQPCAVQEPYEMVSYHFIRYGLTLTKFNVQQSAGTFRKHEQYMKELEQTGNVIAEATFGDREGSILIMKGELDKRVVEASPAVQEQLFEIEVKSLWVAKGSFCEKK